MTPDITNPAIKNIVIIGGGVIGWSAAVGLARGLQGQNVSISLIDQEPLEAAVMSVSPQIFDYHRILALQEKHLFQSGDAKLCLARCYQGISNSDSPVYLAYDSALPEFHSIELHQVLRWLGKTDYSPYSVPAAAAQANKLALPAKGQAGIQSNFSAGLNVNAQAYKNYMQGAAIQLGVTRHEQSIAEIKLNESNSFVSYISLTNGQRLDADLVIDNSGTNSIVMRQLYGREYLSSPTAQVINSRLQAQSFVSNTASPYSKHIACEHGWLEIIDMTNCITGILHYNNQVFSLEQAQNALRQHMATNASRLNKEEELHFTSLATTPGSLSQFFYKNCVAIGEAAGYVGCPSIENIVLAQRAITKLLDLFPSKTCLPANQNEYNRRVRLDFKQAQDFLQLHYFLAKTAETSGPWSKLSELSDELAQRIALFESSSFVAYELNPMINRQSWINLFFAGLQINHSFDPLLNVLDKSEATLYLQKIAQQVVQHLQNFNQYA